MQFGAVAELLERPVPVGEDNGDPFLRDTSREPNWVDPVDRLS